MLKSLLLSGRQGKKLTRRKIVFVIVEGPSDEEALGLFFESIFDKNSVHVHVVHGDLTTRSGNIKHAIANEVRGYAKSNHFKKGDFQEVIHIVDMDGAYIHDSGVIEDSTAKDPMYSTTEIRTSSPEKIRSRNAQKKNNLNVISSLKKVWGSVDYKSYYMSCNLDHVLYNKLNCSDNEKARLSHAFAKKYKKDVSGFVKFISDSDFSVPGDYNATWDFIKNEKHSLERHTNLGICLEK